MKTKILLLLSLLFIVSSCDEDATEGLVIDPDDIIDNENIIVVDEGADSGNPKIFISPNEVIVKYDPGVSQDSVRKDFPLLNYKKCDCGDTNIELWVFDPGIDELEIEGVVQRLSRRSGTRGERSFDIQLTPVGPFPQPGQDVLADTVGLVGPASSLSVNIAVIDTGLDFKRYLNTESPEKFLFPSGYYSYCYDTGTGWNFTGEGDPNFVDDNGHGTYVTKIMTDELDKKGVDYQILPLKVFDASGRGSYWDVLCSLAYVKDINHFRKVIDIVNASFGGGLPREFFDEPEAGETENIFTEMLEALNDQGTLVITSAGNKGEDNDTGVEGDFLSSFRSPNIISVGGYEYDTINPAARPITLHRLSNYGSDGSVDIALAFNNYEIIYDTSDSLRKQRVTLHGTSYAAGALSGKAGTLIDSLGNLSIEDLKTHIFNLTEHAPQLDGKIVDGRALIREE
ncbi:S8 family serine peptidase [Zobellia galactanivorans]|uniref:Serine peptidase, family S8 n=1 Tax=Zobellia galactanivorans (strain DSM 12802 / CCUG 47099 / CIP 106680 / NCIMB 13871 / Dsij) TaxID=63186 RepID=G0L273_ZOBGA|nr:S8 family serine peptidase [Zobellia galactanivorans]CAZ94992.1 Serine peptidase, family S8 [Zobellia galactanivorans]